MALPKLEVTSKKKAAKAKAQSKQQAPAASPSPTQPNDEAAPAPETASQQIEGNAQATAASISVMTQDEIKATGVGSVQDVARHTPNAILSDQGSPRFTVNTVRGIGSTVRDDYFNSSLGIFIDGVPATTAEYSRRLGDVESVEILRGPQGVLFGSNTPAGVINITSRAPTTKPEAEIQGTIGDNGQRGGSAFLSGPIAGKVLTGRAFLDYVERDGFTDYASTGKSIDDLDAVTGSASLLFRPNAQFTATLSGFAEHTNQGAYAFQAFDAYKRRVLDIDAPNEEVRDSHGLAANVSYDFGAVQVRSITGYRAYDVEAAQDLSYNPLIASLGGARTTSQEDGEQFSQDLRFTGQIGTGFQWTAGAFYQNTSLDYDFSQASAIGMIGGSYSLLSQYERSEVAGYGEGTLTVARGLDLTAGVRVAKERHSAENNFGLSGEEDYTLVTPKFAASYHFDSDRQVYVSATRGARSGGFNRLSANDEFDPEYMWSYEASLKSEWFARKLTFNAAVFHIDWTDQQVRTLVPAGRLIENAGESYSQGFELEARWRPMAGFELAGFYGVTRGEYEKYVNRFGADLSGNDLVNTPEMTAGLSVQYRWPILNSRLDAMVRGDYLYTGDQFFDAENLLKQEGYGLVNLRAGIESDTFSAYVFAKNLFDEDYRTYGYRDFVGYDLAIAGESRLVGVTAAWRY